MKNTTDKDMKNTTETYPEMVRRLIKDPQDVADSLQQDLLKADAAHMGLGLGGEVLELFDNFLEPDFKNILEEAGDVLFYTVGEWLSCRAAEPMPHLGTYEELEVTDNFQTCLLRLAHSAEIVLNYSKKYCMYNNPKFKDSDAFVQAWRETIHFTFMMARIAGYTPGEVMDANCIKLDGSRYKDGYSDAAAAKRSDKNES